MMNIAQAVKYGEEIGCRYYVVNSNGGLMGGFITKEAAQEYKAKCEREYKDDPWNKDLRFSIEAH